MNLLDVDGRRFRVLIVSSSCVEVLIFLIIWPVNLSWPDCVHVAAVCLWWWWCITGFVCMWRTLSSTQRINKEQNNKKSAGCLFVLQSERFIFTSLLPSFLSYLISSFPLYTRLTRWTFIFSNTPALTVKMNIYNVGGIIQTLWLTGPTSQSACRQRLLMNIQQQLLNTKPDSDR